MYLNFFSNFLIALSSIFMSGTSLSSTRTKESSRHHGNIFHQRKPSLTTVCPPTDKRVEKRKNSTQLGPIRTNTFKRSRMNKVLDMSTVQIVGWAYVLICFCLSTVHLFNSFATLDPNRGN